jgi:hypothetical protein
MDTVHRAVALIGPDEHLRAKCVTAVHVALSMTSGSAKDIQRFSQRRGKPGKHAVARLHKALQDVQKWIQDPDLPLELRQIMSFDDLARAIELVNEERTKTGERRYPYKATKKLFAAEQAHFLMRQYSNRKITAGKGSALCRLAALLCGEPPARLQWTCRGVISRAKSTAVLRSENK